MRAAVAAALLVCTLAWGAASSASAATNAPSHGIEWLQLYRSGGFVHVRAWFRESGRGTSWVHTWIDTYSASSRQLTGSLGHRTGTSSCDAGRTCYVLLSTSLQIRPGECYVARAMSGRGGELVDARWPQSTLFCP
jgi:hypothetical protein